MTYRGVEICFARSCKHQQNRVASLSCFSYFYPVFLCSHQPTLRSPSYVMIMPVGFETVSYSRLDLPYTQIQCQTEDTQTERVRLVVVVVSIVIRILYYILYYIYYIILY